MTFVINELRQLLSPSQSALGVVVGIRSGAYQIATPQGLKTVASLDTLSIGDRVTLKNGVAIKTPAPSRTYYV